VLIISTAIPKQLQTLKQSIVATVKPDLGNIDAQQQLCSTLKRNKRKEQQEFADEIHDQLDTTTRKAMELVLEKGVSVC
jgi:hypothetical protein